MSTFGEFADEQIAKRDATIRQQVERIATLESGLRRLIALRDEAAMTEPLIENTNIAAIVRWRDRWIDAYANARAALTETATTKGSQG